MNYSGLGAQLSPTFKRWLLKKRRIEAERTDNGRKWVLRASSRVRWVYSALIPLSISMFAICRTLPPELENLLLRWVAVVVFVFSLYLQIDFAWSRAIMDKAGIDFRLLFFPGRFMKWDDVIEVTCTSFMSEYSACRIIFTDRDGRRRRIPEFWDGMGTLRALLEQNVKPEVWKGARGVLPAEAEEQVELKPVR